MLTALLGCTSLGSRFDRERDAAAARQPRDPQTVVTEADLAPLPPPAARWLRRVGVVGRPRVRNFVVEMDARLNRGPGEPWMETPVLQVSFTDHPTRLFLLRTRMKGLPVTGLHDYTAEGARMTIRVLGAVNIVNESGDAFTRAETVTMLNDLAIFAPAALLDDRVTWTAVDDTSARVTYTNGPHRVAATLFFDGDDQLVDFASDDRGLPPDERARWTTPLRAHRDMGGLWLPGEGDAVWHYPDKPDWLYGRFTIRSVRHNVPDRDLPSARQLAARRRPS
jgi:hypothetical protein